MKKRHRYDEKIYRRRIDGQISAYFPKPTTLVLPIKQQVDFRKPNSELKQTVEESVTSIIADTKVAKDNKRIDDDKHLVIFIHGYSNTKEDIKKREDKIDEFLGTKKILTVAFDWKSYATDWEKWKYKLDKHAAKILAPYFAMFLQQIREKGPFEQIDIIAHSMGNYLLCKAMNYAMDKKNAKIFKGCNILCAAADVQIKYYKKTAMAMNELDTVATWTHFYCTRDRALKISKVANVSLKNVVTLSLSKRAGLSKIDFDFMENIECDALADLQDDYSKHSYIDEVISDDSGYMVGHIRKKLGLESGDEVNQDDEKKNEQ